MSPDEVLAHFPGPITLRPKAINWNIVLVIAVATAILALYARTTVAVMVIVSIGIAIAGLTIWAAMRKDTSADGLVLTADHFEVIEGNHGKTYPWREVGNFRVRHEEDTSSVVFDRVGAGKKTRGRVAKFFGTDYDYKLPKTYEMSEKELASLMNDWRRLACPRPRKPKTPPAQRRKGTAAEDRSVDS
ncbi:hypothetical protein [Mycobacterium asiaticum]|nr:hypothetical protein [Mycobacterium asiaticum]